MQQIILRIKRLFLDISLKRKFIIAYILLLAVPMTITSLLFYSYSTESVQKQTVEVIAQSMKQTTEYVDYILQEIEGLGDVFYNNEALQYALAKKNAIEYDDLTEYTYVLGVLKQISQNQRVFNIRLYVPDNKFYSKERTSIFPFSEIMKDPAISEVLAKKQQRGWSGVREESDSLGRKTKVFSYVVFFADLNNVTRTIAAMRLDLQEESLSGLVGKLGVEKKGVWYLIDREGGIITSSGDIGIKPQDIAMNTESSEISLARLANKNYSIIKQPVQTAEWQLVYCIPSRQLSADTSRIGVFTLFVFLVLLMLSALAAIFISDRITSKITLLTQRMKSIQEEIYDKGDEVIEHEKDEIGALQENYEIMLKKLRKLILDNYQAQLEKKEARLRLLQAQINPHFLYNVLDQINWMGVRAKSQEISEVVTKLGRFYRIGLSKGKEIITLAEELEHVRIYIDIQKYRLGEAVNFSFKIGDGIGNHKIIKLVLQPLVENAIVHGILETDEQTGNVVIEAWRNDDLVTVLVKDDAGLLNIEKLMRILESPDEGKPGGYGLRNLDERLRLFSSNERGLNFYLDDRGWSVFEFSFPIY